MAHGGKLLADCLYALGARQMFGVPGESFLAFLDALHDTDGLNLTLTRNEGGAAFAAAAWGKLTGQPGIAVVTRGPGATNASIGVHTAMQDSTPMILLVGQVGTDARDREAFQELNYRAVFGSMAKWVTEIDQTDRIPELIGQAWMRATSGRPGPVVVALPEDMLSAQTGATPLDGIAKVVQAHPDPNAIVSAAQMLRQAQRPVVLLGGGGWSEIGNRAVEDFATRANIPVVAAFRCQDQFDNTLPVYAGDSGTGVTPATKALIREADVVLALNIRFGEITTQGYTLFDVPRPHQTLIHAHISPEEIGKVYQPDLGITGAPDPVAQALAAQNVSGDWGDWTAKARQGYLDALVLPDLPSPVDMGKVMEHLRDVLADDAILTCGAGNFAIWPMKFFAYGRNHRLLGPQAGAMGYGLPAAIAAKVAHPDRQVVCFAGDGDIQMGIGELGTAMQAGAQPIILVLNNGTYGTIRMHQETHYPARVSGTTLENPDFAALARAYGFHGERVEKTEDFCPAFDRALASPTGAVLDLNIATEAISPRTTLSDLRAKHQS